MSLINRLATAILFALFPSVSFAQVETVTFKTAVSELRAEVNKAGEVTLLRSSIERAMEAHKKGLPFNFIVDFEGFLKVLTSDDESRACALRIVSPTSYKGPYTNARNTNLKVLQKQLAVLEAHQQKWGRVEPTVHSRKFKAFALDASIKMLKEALAGTSNQAWVETAKQMTFYFDSLTPATNKPEPI